MKEFDTAQAALEQRLALRPGAQRASDLLEFA